MYLLDCNWRLHIFPDLYTGIIFVTLKFFEGVTKRHHSSLLQQLITSIRFSIFLKTFSLIIDDFHINFKKYPMCNKIIDIVRYCQLTLILHCLDKFIHTCSKNRKLSNCIIWIVIFRNIDQ